MKYLIVLSLVVLSACTTKNDRDMNTDYQWSMSHAQQKRMETIAEISKQGESGVIAAALLMQQEQEIYHQQAPKSSGDKFLEAVTTLTPAIGNTLIGVGQIAATVYSAEVQKDIAINNSNNNAEVTKHTNDTMAGIAKVTVVQPTIVETTTVNN